MPVFLTVYSYFICGSPPRLLLGHLSTGKILFLIFSFSVLIVSTLFQSGMTTLLSDRLRYPNIDTLSGLVESDLFIQSIEPKKTHSYFDQQPQYDGIRDKLLTSYHDYNMLLLDPFYRNYSGDTLLLHDINGRARATMISTDGNRTAKKIMENINSMMESDAFLLSAPYTFIRKNTVTLTELKTGQGYNYHVVKECLTTYPLLFPFLKNMFLFDEISSIIAQLLETGHVKRKFEEANGFYSFSMVASPQKDIAEARRPYNLTDLQPAFFSLLIGYLISFLCFIGELLLDYNRNLGFFDLLKRSMKKYSFLKFK